MKRTMCGRGRRGDSLLHHSFWASLCQGTQPNSLESVTLSYALGEQSQAGMFIMVSKCLAAAASSAGRDKSPGEQETCSHLPLPPTSISGVRTPLRDLGRGVCFSGQQAKA